LNQAIIEEPQDESLIGIPIDEGDLQDEKNDDLMISEIDSNNQNYYDNKHDSMIANFRDDIDCESK